MESQNTKKWWQSKGVNGALLAIGGTVGGFFGINIDADFIQGVISLGEQAYMLGMQGVTLAGAALALWGRLRADKAIK